MTRVIRDHGHEVADDAGVVLPVGSGLPEQWTVGAGDEVTAESDAGEVPLTVIASDDATPALVVRAVATPAQATALLAWHNNLDQPVGDVDSGGNLFIYEPGVTVRVVLASDGRLVINAKDSAIAAIDPFVTFQVDDNLAPFRCFTAGGASATSIAAGGAQTALEITTNDEDDDAINVVGAPDWNGGEFRVWGDGKFSTRAHTAPADGDLAAGEMAVWFDPTNGAAKLKIKAKTLNGTVVVGEVALT